jgi:hypothetical protein
MPAVRFMASAVALEAADRLPEIALANPGLSRLLLLVTLRLPAMLWAGRRCRDCWKSAIVPCRTELI